MKKIYNHTERDVERVIPWVIKSNQPSKAAFSSAHLLYAVGWGRLIMKWRITVMEKGVGGR